MPDEVLVPEIQRVCNELEKIEKDMSSDEKRERHIVFQGDPEFAFGVYPETKRLPISNNSISHLEV